MKEYKKEFIKFLIKNNALKFGSFTLKSGRISPYFLNTGTLHTGQTINRLGYFYARAITDNIKIKFSTVFGPAYKGIPLCVTVANSLYLDFKININYAFNRKELKDHGDKGLIVGKKLIEKDILVLVDDVITAGTAIRESLSIIKRAGNAQVIAVVLSVDRMEKGEGEQSAIAELKKNSGIQFYPIVNILEIMEFLKNYQIDGQNFLPEESYQKMCRYRDIYGVS